MLAGVGVTLCFTLTGNNMIVSFMDVLLAGAGANAFWASLGYATAQVVAALVMAGGVAERFGRRDLMRLSAALSSACLIGLGLCARASASAAAGGAFIAIGMAFICAVTLGLSTLCWVYCAEVMPMVRGKAMGLANLCFWVSLLHGRLVPSLAVSIGGPTSSSSTRRSRALVPLRALVLRRDARLQPTGSRSASPRSAAPRAVEERARAARCRRVRRLPMSRFPRPGARGYHLLSPAPSPPPLRLRPPLASQPPRSAWQPRPHVGVAHRLSSAEWRKSARAAARGGPRPDTATRGE